MFETRNISFAYGSREILRDISFVVSPGETVSVIGDNGTGKTTLLKLLSTQLLPDAGSVMVDGQNAFQNPIRYRRQLGYLPEKLALYEDMTVREYLEYRAVLKGELPKRIRRRVQESAEMCRVQGLLRSPIGGLSYGLKKRVALADALLLRPRVLLLDDFLAGLDADTRDTAGEILSNAAAFSSVIVTGHELEDLARWTTRFLVLRHGTITSVVPTAGVESQVLRERLRVALRGGLA